jgi:hypothetical protein
LILLGRLPVVAQVVAVSGVAVLSASIQVVADPPSPLTLEIQVEPGAAAAALAQKQCVGWSAALDGASVPVIQDSVTVTPGSLDNRLGTWSLGLPSPSAFGDPVSYRGAAPPGLRSVGISGIYKTDAGIFEVPLITNGIVETESRELNDNGVLTATYSGRCAIGRYDRAIGDLRLPPGHGLSRAEEVRRLFVSAGIPSTALPHGGSCMKPLQTRGEAAIELAEQIMRVPGYVLRMDPFGRIEALVDGYNPGRPVDMQMYVAAGSFRSGPANADAGTRITLTGTGQVTRDSCARTQKPVHEQETRATVAPVIQGFEQQGDGSLTPVTGITSEPYEQTVSLVVTSGEEECGAAILDRTVTWGLYNQGAARYQQDGDGNRTPQQFVFLPTDAVEADDSLGVRDRYETLQVIGHEEVRHYYDAEGYLSRRVTRRQAPRFTQAALQLRSSVLVDWDAAGYEPDQYLLGNGAGVLEPEEWMPIAEQIPAGMESEIIEETFHRDGAFLTGTTSARSTWWRPSGRFYLYSDGEFGAPAATFGAYETVYVNYLADGKGSHYSVTSTVTGEDKPRIEIDRGTRGYQPPAPRKPGLEPDPALFDNEAQASSARPAHRQEVQPIEATYVNWAREAVAGIHELPTRAEQLAENEIELAAMAQREIREAGAIPVTWDHPVVFQARPGWHVKLQVPGVNLLGHGSGVPFSVYVRSVTHKSSNGGRTWISSFTGRVYV